MSKSHSFNLYLIQSVNKSPSVSNYKACFFNKSHSNISSMETLLIYPRGEIGKLWETGEGFHTTNSESLISEAWSGKLERVSGSLIPESNKECRWRLLSSKYWLNTGRKAPMWRSSWCQRHISKASKRPRRLALSWEALVQLESPVFFTGVIDQVQSLLLNSHVALGKLCNFSWAQFLPYHEHSLILWL